MAKATAIAATSALQTAAPEPWSLPEAEKLATGGHKVKGHR